MLPSELEARAGHMDEITECMALQPILDEMAERLKATNPEGPGT